MVRLLVVLLLALSFCAADVFGSEVDDLARLIEKDLRISHQDAKQASQSALSIRNDIRRDKITAIARHGDTALDFLVNLGARELEKRGDGEYAYFKLMEWDREFKGYLVRTISGRHIGDHPTEMLSVWLEEYYDRLELVLGVSMCKFLHLSDIKTINCATKIVFKPCSFAMDSVSAGREEEYRNHFAKDNGADELYGEVPVITYWAAEIGLIAAGVPFVSGIVASAAEYAMGKWIAPKLSNWIWEGACL